MTSKFTFGVEKKLFFVVDFSEIRIFIYRADLLLRDWCSNYLGIKSERIHHSGKAVGILFRVGIIIDHINKLII